MFLHIRSNVLNYYENMEYAKKSKVYAREKARAEGYAKKCMQYVRIKDEMARLRSSEQVLVAVIPPRLPWSGGIISLGTRG